MPGIRSLFSTRKVHGYPCAWANPVVVAATIVEPGYEAALSWRLINGHSSPDLGAGRREGATGALIISPDTLILETSSLSR